VINAVFALAHDDVLAGHFAAPRTIQAIRSAVTWPTLDADIRRRVRHCAACQKLRATPPPPSEILSTCATWPFENIMFDFVGPFPESHGFFYIFTIIDRFSRNVMARPCVNQTARAAADGLWD